MRQRRCIVICIEALHLSGECNKTSAVAEIGDRLAIIGMDRKWGGAAVGAGSPLGPHLTQCGLGRGGQLYQVAS